MARMPSSLSLSASTSPSSTTQTIVVVSTALVSACLTAIMAYAWHSQSMARANHTWQARRQEERTGRIRAELKLRTLIKQQQQQSTIQQGRNDNIETKKKKTAIPANTTMTLQAIGTIVSPYTKRMGTPRQGALVPSSRGHVVIHSSYCPPQALDGIQEYSHVWIVFEFHANTNVANVRSKIRPPRAPSNTKCGVLATRSPHRPNAIGLSLVKVEHWDETNKCLHISGLDLVHGTPVYDIKPVTPWDLPGYLGPQGQQQVENSGTAIPSVLKTPTWVHQDDALTLVVFEESALDALHTLVQSGRLAPLYTVENDGYAAARDTLDQILAQDPRSSHKGLKDNARGTRSAVDSPYSLVFGKILVKFVVDTEKVTVVSIEAIDFDSNAYVDGVPLISGAT